MADTHSTTNSSQETSSRLEEKVEEEAVDVESAKRNLQALVAAGMHAHGLLGNNEDEEEDDDDEEGNGSVEGSEEEELTSGFVGPRGGKEEENDQAIHQALLSRVANNFRALIGHGLTTTAMGEGGGGDGAELDDEEAYDLACQTLEQNLKYQRMLREQLAELGVAQWRNKEQQEKIGTLLTMQARATTRRGGRRNRDDRTGSVDPVTNESRIMASCFFVDMEGRKPPDNRDAIRKKKHPPIVYRSRRWTDVEREALARGVRQNNRKLILQRLYQQTSDPRAIWEADRIPDQDLEMNLSGLDWKYISSEFVSQHKPVECAIQWATQDHPVINKAPWTKKEEKALKEVVEKHDGYDWAAIANELDTQRTASQCFQVYQRKLNADMSRSKWTPEEDQLLHEAVMAYGEGDWQAVAACLDNRTGQQVLHRWCKSINPAIRSGRWDRDEDVALLAAVRLYGVGQWTKIAKHVPGRTDVKCRERYMNVLTPDVNNSQWTSEEDERLIEIVGRVGIGKWSYVADLLGGRTDNQCWRHWRSLHKRGKAPDPPSDVEDESGEEGTVPSFPEWEAECRRRRRSLQPTPTPGSGTAEDTLFSFAHTQGSGRKRKTTTGIESARKRQWKRATSTTLVPLLPSTSAAEKAVPASSVASPSTSRAPLPHTLRSRSSGSVLTSGHMAGDGNNSHLYSAGLTAHNRLSLSLDGNGEALSPLLSAAAASSGSGRRRLSGVRRGRVLNWNNILHAGEEGKASANTDPDAHIRPVLPFPGTIQGLQRLVGVVPEVAAAFNAELVGIGEGNDSENATSAMDSVPMSLLRQRIESLFIWPLMMGTLDTSSRNNGNES